MKLALSHPTGNANVRAVANGFLSAGILATYYTSIAVFANSPLYKISSINALSDIRRRELEISLKAFTKTNPWLEIGRLIAPKAGLKSLVKHETGKFSVDAVYKNHDSWVGKELTRCDADTLAAVYAYEDGAMESFSRAKKRGIECFYDLPIGYWRAARKLMEIETEKWPAWSATLTGLKDSQNKLQRKDEELRLADHIFVASSFTAKTLVQYPGKLAPISVIPYGFPNVSAEKREYSFDGSRPLRILFVGGLSQRKGIANLFDAVKKVGSKVQLTVVGKRPVDNCAALNEALADNHWIPSLPHHEILELMRTQDVLIFPSLFEGFGLVITEAMSQGTPVITTDRTAGPDLIKHGEDGWIIEAGSSEAIQDVIEHLLSNPDEIKNAGTKALETASRRPWSVYGEELSKAIRKLA